jgi:PIN domain nuclease of toxin-antitoxin system
LNLLFDTQLFVWACEGGERLSAQAIDLFADTRTVPYFSAVSVWEVAIKAALNKPDFDTDPREFYRNLLAFGFRELPMTSDHALLVRDLPLLHHDPFDRLIVAQALAEDLTLVTADRKLARYPGRIELV